MFTTGVCSRVPGYMSLETPGYMPSGIPGYVPQGVPGYVPLGVYPGKCLRRYPGIGIWGYPGINSSVDTRVYAPGHTRVFGSLEVPGYMPKYDQITGSGTRVPQSTYIPYYSRTTHCNMAEENHPGWRGAASRGVGINSPPLIGNLVGPLVCISGRKFSSVRGFIHRLFSRSYRRGGDGTGGVQRKILRPSKMLPL